MTLKTSQNGTISDIVEIFQTFIFTFQINYVWVPDQFLIDIRIELFTHIKSTPMNDLLLKELVLFHVSGLSNYHLPEKHFNLNWSDFWQLRGPNSPLGIIHCKAKKSQSSQSHICSPLWGSLEILGIWNISWCKPGVSKLRPVGKLQPSNWL